MAAPNQPSNSSPRWGSTTKLVIGLTIVAIIAGLIVYFRNIIGPLLLSLIMASLIQPLAAWISKRTHMSWRLVINLLYLVLLVFLIGLFTAAGVAIVQQAQSLIEFVRQFINDLPSTIDRFTSNVYQIGPFQLHLAQYDLQATARQALGIIEPLLGRAGGLLAVLASGAASLVWWGLFILLISYFLLTEAGRWSESLVHIEIPGYQTDTKHLLTELSRIWGAFFRGQLIYALLIFIAYSILLTVLGMQLSLAIALVAGMSAFIPYVGAAITWVVVVAVALLQNSNYFGLAPFYYALLVLGLCLALNQVFDNVVFPRIMGSRLGVHPAGVLIAAIIVTDLIGLVGLLLAAPMLATLALLSRYIGRKMFDLDPWAEEQNGILQPPGPIKPFWSRLKGLLKNNDRQQASKAPVEKEKEQE
jgi:predicted PurR-regulated permease PerM